MEAYGQDPEKMQLIINMVSESNDQPRVSTRKEYIKIFGMMAQLYEDKMLGAFHKVVNTLFKKLKDGDTTYQQIISNSIGLMVEHCLKSLSFKEQESYLSGLFKTIYSNLQQSNKSIQVIRSLHPKP